MKTLMHVLSALISICLFVGCSSGKNGADGKTSVIDQPSTSPTLSIWNYSDVSDSIGGAANFGDASKGYVPYAQVVSFGDGGGEISVMATAINGTNSPWPIYFYVAPGTTTFSQAFVDPNGTNTYIVSGDLSTTTPTLSVDFDDNGNTADTTPKVLGLVKQ